MLPTSSLMAAAIIQMERNPSSIFRNFGRNNEQQFSTCRSLADSRTYYMLSHAHTISCYKRQPQLTNEMSPESQCRCDVTVCMCAPLFQMHKRFCNIIIRCRYLCQPIKCLFLSNVSHRMPTNFREEERDRDRERTWENPLLFFRYV